MRYHIVWTRDKFGDLFNYKEKCGESLNILYTYVAKYMTGGSKRRVSVEECNCQ
jgi:hypothetical protein